MHHVDVHKDADAAGARAGQVNVLGGVEAVPPGQVTDGVHDDLVAHEVKISCGVFVRFFVRLFVCLFVRLFMRVLLCLRLFLLVYRLILIFNFRA